MKTLKTLAILTAIVALISCSPQAKLNRLVKKHPELIAKDTVKVYDTIVYPLVVTDTLIENKITRDTIVIKEKQLEIKYFNDGKNVYIKGKSDTVVVVKEIKVPVDKYIITEEKIKWYKDWKLWLFIGFVLGIFITFASIFYIHKK